MTLPLLACGILLMLRRSRDPLAPWASLTMLALVACNGPSGGWLHTRLANQPVLDDAISGTALALLVGVLALFPDGRLTPRWSLAVAVIGALVVFATALLPSAPSNIITGVVMLAAISAVLARYRRLPAGAGRQQVRWALLGFMGSVLSLALLAITQALWARAYSYGAYAWLSLAVSLLSAAFVAPLAVAMTVALLRWRLYGADATISRSVSYGLLTLGLLAVFAGFEKLFEIMGEHYLGGQLGAVAGALGAAAAAVTIAPLHHRVTRWAERRFRGGLAHLREGLPLLVANLRETAAPAALADAMLARIELGVRARHGAVVTGGVVLDARDLAPAVVAAWLADHPLPGAPSAPTADRTDPLFPLRMPLAADGVGLVGWLLLGPRPDGSFYGREERAALAEIADPIARALAIALAREEREALRGKEAEAVRREVGELRRLVLTLQQRVGVTPA